MSETEYLKLSDIDAYKTAFHLSNFVWDVMMKWNQLAQKSIGLQFINAVDSISANIAEGFRRFNKKDKIKFYRYSQGSRKDCYDWNEKAKVRNLIQPDEYQHIFIELEKLGPAIARLNKFTNEKLSQ